MALSITTKCMHLLIAITMICLICVGIYMSNTETFSLYPIHKSIGIIVFIFAVYRIVNRIKEGWPTPIGKASKMQLLLAKMTHWGLITMTVVYPISGMMMSGGGGHGIYVFGLELVAAIYDEISGKAVALNEQIASIGHTLHSGLVPIIIALIVLHIAGALKHHFIEKDQTISRMFSFKNKSK